MNLPDRARIVIIGGGAIGTSIAYHLAKAGERDVVLLEKSGLTHGATWHAAGLVGQLRSKRNLTRMMQYSVELYSKLEEETGIATDWKDVGSLRIASSKERWLEIQRTAGQAGAFGLDLQLLSAHEAKDLFPYMSTDGVVGAAFVKGDGQIDPSGLTQAYAKGARNGGVRICEGVQVKDIIIVKNRVTGVSTDHGNVGCDILVNAAGLWARKVAEMAGISLPAGVVEHQYMVTEKGLDLAPDTPTFRDPDNIFYLKPDVGGFAIGGWEAKPPAINDPGLPFEFGQELFTSNFDRFENVILPAAQRLPILNDIGIQTLINGPIPISPDGEPIMGQAPEVENMFMACGFTSGIAASGGAGMCMANWILEGDPGMDLWAFDLRRFGSHHGNINVLNERAQESYSRYYSLHWPGEEMETVRGARRSPIYDTLKSKGAVHGSKFGWERPNWFALDGTPPIDQPSFGRANWFEYVGQEHLAVRDKVAVFDQSSFSKFEVFGPGSLKFLNHLAAGQIDRPVGAAIYTQLCNERGGIEADLTIIRLAENNFYVVTGSGFGIRDGHWIQSHLPDDGSVQMRDITSSKAVLNIQGPLSRAVLDKISNDDLSDQTFPYLTAKEIQIGYATVLAVRITYVGELGWELHIPTEFTAHVYDTIFEAGQEFGIINAGYRAIDTLRMEKRYLYWGADIGPDYSPLQAGLGFCVAWNKSDFIGRQPLLRERDAGPKQRLRCYLLDEDAPVYGGESMIIDGTPKGITTSGNFGHSVGKNVVFGYLPTDIGAPDTIVIESFGRQITASFCKGTPFDPERAKILI
jgi:sarcosine dehydrogenase